MFLWDMPTRLQLFNFPGTMTTALRNLEHELRGEVKIEIYAALRNGKLLRETAAVPSRLSMASLLGSWLLVCRVHAENYLI
uniref:Uncharacterized protein n=1 Tax=Caenorhabditis japonica TaxID=281687 RepID=A0A8R1E4X5_CAEJA